ncbi:MAG: hypothetical protein ACREBC_36885, partial [Pyrinomonadaceae bacterium]
RSRRLKSGGKAENSRPMTFEANPARGNKLSEFLKGHEVRFVGAPETWLKIGREFTLPPC